MGVVSLFLVPLMALQGPITDLVTYLPYGDQLALAVKPDGTRAYVAEGGSIAYLNLAIPAPPQEPSVIARFEIPDCSPQALLYFEQSQPYKEYLFIAGGSMGLWRIEPLFSNLDPYLVEGPIETNFERKRCRDIAVVRGNSVTGGNPVLFALYSATSKAGASQGGPTEVRAYRLRTDGTTPRFPSSTSSIVFPTTPAGSIASVGTALASDPNDRDSVYVAMGKGGIYRIDIQGPPSNPTLVSTPIFTFPSVNPSITLDNVRDLAVARTSSPGAGKSFLYAALNYGRILEFDLSVPTPTPFLNTPQAQYIERIAAVSDGGSNVIVAVALENEPAMTTESRAPIRTTGFWSTICIGPGIGDPDVPSDAITPTNEIMFFGRNTADPNQPGLARILDSANPTLPIAFDPFWGSLILRAQSSLQFYCYACSAFGQTAVYKLLFPFGIQSNAALPPPGVPPIGPSPIMAEITLDRTYTQNRFFGAWDGAVSDVDSRVLRFGHEAGPGVSTGAMLYVGSGPSGPELEPITGTNSLCPSGWSSPPCTTPEGDHPCASTDPNPFATHLFGEAHWVDPAAPTLEWFLAGGKVFIPLEVVTAPTCSCQDLLDDCQVVHCATPWRTKLSGEPGKRLGYRLARLDLATQPPTGSSMNLNWWQVEAPDLLPDSERTDATDYLRAEADPRRDEGGVPVLIHGVRGASPEGLLLYQPRAVMDAALTTCPGTGKGQQLPWETITQQINTHFELETGVGGTCFLDTDPECDEDASPVQARQLSNSRSHVFEVIDSQGDSLWVIAVASGYPASGTEENLTEATCKWRRFYAQPMVNFYDITETGASFLAPRLLRIALRTLPPTADPDTNAKGLAWVVTTKTYGSGPDAKTFAFVGDLIGNLLVYNVSFDRLFPAATDPYLREFIAGVPQPTDVLFPVQVIPFPRDPYDGWNCNCVDLEIHGDYLYCALGRAGMGIANVSDPMNVTLDAVLDTPGMALGIVLRSDVGAPEGVQVIVGDSKCGVRLYQ